MKKIKWSIDKAHSEIGFKVKYLMIANVRGVFKEFEASIYTTGSDFRTAEIDFWMNPNSIDTHDQKREEHLKSADFFDVKKFKEIHFIGNTIEAIDQEGNYKLYGDLIIKNIKKQIKLDLKYGGIMKDPWGIEKAILNIHGKINRKDWNLHWNTILETGGVLVSEEVWIRCEIQLIKDIE